MKQTKKEEVITFKVDESLAEAMEGIRNRSEFIRRAILAALDSTCPLCQGTGILTPSQQDHWRDFSKYHHVEQCKTCNETRLVCDIESVEHGGKG